MERIFSVIMLSLLSLAASAQFKSSAYQDLYDSETVGDMRRHVEYLSSSQMEGRLAGSEGEKLVADYVRDKFSEYGIELISGRDGDIFGLKQENADTLVSRNVVGALLGYDKKMREKYIVIGARMDNLGTHTMTVDGERVENIYYGANGNASGMAMLLELARKLSTNQLLLKKSVLFVAFGASEQGYAGSWYFLNRSFKDVDCIEAMINLDMLGGGRDAFYAYSSSNKDMNDVIQAVSSDMQPIRPEITAAEPYPSDHRSFYAKEIPSVMFTTGRYAEHNTSRDVPSIIDYEQMERELEYICNFSLTLCSTERNIAFRPEELVAPGFKDSDVFSYYDCDLKPSFLNSMDPTVFLEKWVYPYLKYPQSAVEEGVQGTVQVSFIIEKDGKLTNAEVVKSVDARLDAQAIKVIMASPKWKPARVRGQKVRSIMTIPVEFRLQKKTEKRKFGINSNK